MSENAQRYCSFCGISQRQTEWMLAGPWPTNICAECVHTAAAQIERLRKDKIEQDFMIKEALRCSFCTPASIQCEAIHA